jgi:hypothetical protein
MSNESPKSIHLMAKSCLRELQEEAKWLIGRDIEIKSNYNGQDWGTSKKSLKGTIQKIASVFVDRDGLFISIEGYQYGHPMLAIDEWILS